jgi:lysophospholipase L1-like esterase
MDSYYLSLGDSLAAGVQPIPPKGPWHDGYADQLFTTLQAKNSSLRLKKLGCYTNESTAVMISGGSHCSYPQGSQLNEAVAFLANHTVALITLSIGAQELLDVFATPGPINMRCLDNGLADIKKNLPTILKTLQKAAGKDIPIVGMNYYEPSLAHWLLGASGHVVATDSVKVIIMLNDTLEQIYNAAGSPVADVEGAFSTTDFATMVVSPDFGTIPLNVARICQWTWLCAALGPDIHANTEGYGVIARAFLKVLP